MITPYKSDKSKTDQVRDMFDAIAPKYDLLNHLLSLGIDRGWRRTMVRMVARTNPRQILDLATGTGDLAIALKRANPKAQVTGADLSPEMLEIGRRKIAKAGLDIQMVVTDAESLNFAANGQFDTVTAAFGVRNFENTLAGITQMYRVTAIDGRIWVLEFSTPRPGSLFAWGYKFYFHKILPRIGRLISKDSRAYDYLPESVANFPHGAQFVALLEKAGFSNGQFKPLMGGIATIYWAQKLDQE